VQIARGLGASVTATAATSDLELVRSLSTDRLIDFQNRSFDDELSGLDVVLDTVGGDTLRRSWGVLRPGGRLVTLGAPPDATMAKRFGVEGLFFVVTPDANQLAHLAAIAVEGSLRSLVSQTFPLIEGRRAL
jgi:NADPH:quinone reductase-like Zn-dependent oxidoreductase